MSRWSRALLAIGVLAILPATGFAKRASPRSAAEARARRDVEEGSDVLAGVGATVVQTYRIPPPFRGFGDTYLLFSKPAPVAREMICRVSVTRLRQPEGAPAEIVGVEDRFKRKPPMTGACDADVNSYWLLRTVSHSPASNGISALNLLQEARNALARRNPAWTVDCTLPTQECGADALTTALAEESLGTVFDCARRDPPAIGTRAEACFWYSHGGLNAPVIDQVWVRIEEAGGRSTIRLVKAPNVIAD